MADRLMNRVMLTAAIACVCVGCEEPVVTGSGATPAEGAVYSYGSAAAVHDSPSLGGDQQDCYWDSSCDEGFVCIGICQQKQETPGVLAGPCDASGACQQGLECRTGSVCVDPVALGDIYESWTQSEELLADELGLIQLDQRLDPEDDAPIQGPIPSSSRLKNFLPPVGNQGGQGSCASWSVGYGMRGYQAAKLRGFWSASTEHLLSPTFLYTQLNTSCEGTNTGRNVDLLAEQGIPTLSVLPYIGLEAACVAELDDEIREAAALNKSKGRVTLFNKRGELTESLGTEDVIDEEDMRKIKYTIFSGHPVVISIKTYREFIDLKGDVLSRITKKNEGKHSYHAIVVVGYDDTSQVMTILNSWSPTWGDMGYGKISYDVFKKTTGAAFYSVPLPPPPPEVLGPELPDPNGSSTCDGVSNLTCSTDKSSVIETCDGQTLTTTTCAMDELCYQRAPNRGEPNVSGVTGCYSRQEIRENCGEQNVIDRCAPANSDSGRGKKLEVCFDTTLFTQTCASGELCTARSGAPECVDAMTLEAECMGGLVRGCDISLDEPGKTYIEERCEGEVVRRIACRAGTTCHADGGSDPACLDEAELEMACGEGGYELSCLNVGSSMIVSSCQGKLLSIEEPCDDPDLAGDDEHVCRRGLSPDSKPTCEARTDHALEVVLGWDGGHDLDLFVEQPGGVTLSYQRLRDDDTSGFYDASEACLPSSMTCTPGMAYKERVVWREDAMPESGTYSIQIANGRRDVAVPATLTVYANDRIKFSRTITSPARKGERSEAITFTR